MEDWYLITPPTPETVQHILPLYSAPATELPRPSPTPRGMPVQDTETVLSETQYQDTPLSTPETLGVS